MAVDIGVPVEWSDAELEAELFAQLNDLSEEDCQGILESNSEDEDEEGSVRTRVTTLWWRPQNNETAEDVTLRILSSNAEELNLRHVTKRPPSNNAEEDLPETEILSSNLEDLGTNRKSDFWKVFLESAKSTEESLETAEKEILDLQCSLQLSIVDMTVEDIEEEGIIDLEPVEEEDLEPVEKEDSCLLDETTPNQQCEQQTHDDETIILYCSTHCLPTCPSICPIHCSESCVNYTALKLQADVAENKRKREEQRSLAYAKKQLSALSRTDQVESLVREAKRDMTNEASKAWEMNEKENLATKQLYEKVTTQLNARRELLQERRRLASAQEEKMQHELEQEKRKNAMFLEADRQSRAQLWEREKKCFDEARRIQEERIKAMQSEINDLQSATVELSMYDEVVQDERTSTPKESLENDLYALRIEEIASMAEADDEGNEMRKSARREQEERYEMHREEAQVRYLLKQIDVERTLHNIVRVVQNQLQLHAWRRWKRMSEQRAKVQNAQGRISTMMWKLFRWNRTVKRLDEAKDAWQREVLERRRRVEREREQGEIELMGIEDTAVRKLMEIFMQREEKERAKMCGEDENTRRLMEEELREIMRVRGLELGLMREEERRETQRIAMIRDREMELRSREEMDEQERYERHRVRREKDQMGVEVRGMEAEEAYERRRLEEEQTYERRRLEEEEEKEKERIRRKQVEELERIRRAEIERQRLETLASIEAETKRKKEEAEAAKDRIRKDSASTVLQSTFRGFHVRRKIDIALQHAQFVDEDDFEYEDVDLSEFDDLPPECDEGEWAYNPQLRSSKAHRDLAEEENSSGAHREKNANQWVGGSSSLLSNSNSESDSDGDSDSDGSASESESDSDNDSGSEDDESDNEPETEDERNNTSRASFKDTMDVKEAWRGNSREKLHPGSSQGRSENNNSTLLEVADKKESLWARCRRVKQRKIAKKGPNNENGGQTKLSKAQKHPAGVPKSSSAKGTAKSKKNTKRNAAARALVPQLPSTRTVVDSAAWTIGRGGSGPKTVKKSKPFSFVDKLRGRTAASR